jgi:hypothetical protein
VVFNLIDPTDTRTMTSSMHTHPQQPIDRANDTCQVQNGVGLRDQILFLIVGGACLITLYLGVGPNRPLPGDEMRFIATSQTFANQWSLHLLAHYEEMSTPLPFMFFGLWGKLFGFELWVMRLGAMLIAFATLYLVGFCGQTWLNNRRQFWVMGLSLCLANPYFLPMGMMVYTDMIALFFLMLGLWAFGRSNPLGMAMSCMGMLWCRQYLVFLVLAFDITQLWRWRCEPTQRRVALKMCLAMFIGCLPFIGLIWLWQGLTPDNQMQAVYLNQPRMYHITSLVLYCSLLFWFCLPAVWYKWRQIFRCRLSMALLLLLISQFYWFFPVRASVCAIEVNITTVGMMHRIINLIEPHGMLADGVFYFGFLCSLFILRFVYVHTIPILMRKKYAPDQLLFTALLSCLWVMPWSYLHWEKYFLPAIPITLMMILLSDQNKMQSCLSHPFPAISISNES